jgi:hypothetical protein
MNSPTQELREHYESLRGSIESIRTVGEAVGYVPLESLQRGVDAALRVLASDILPLTNAETHTLHPAVGGILGSKSAAAAIQGEGVAITRLVGDLRSVRSRLTSSSAAEKYAPELRRILFGLYQLLCTHVRNEEEVSLPLLDTRLTVEQARRLCAQIEREAAHV